MASRGVTSAALNWGKKAGAGAGSGGHGYQTQATSILRHLLSAIGIGIVGGSFWKVHHLNERRKTEEFYARLEAGEITVAAE